MMIVTIKKSVRKLAFFALINTILCNFFLAHAEITVIPTVVFYDDHYNIHGTLEEIRSYYNNEAEKAWSECMKSAPLESCGKQILSSSWRNYLDGPFQRINGFDPYILFGYGTIPTSYHGKPGTAEHQGIFIRPNFNCPEGFYIKIEGPENDKTAICIYRRSYSAILTESSMLAKSFPEPKMCVANPIEVSNGAKLHNENNIAGSGDLQFSLSYNSAYSQSRTPWYNNFQKAVYPMDATSRILAVGAASYYTEADACYYGWLKIKESLNNNQYADIASAYRCGVCELRRSNQVIGILGVVESTRPIVAGTAETLIQNAIQLQRENSAVKTFIPTQCDINEWRSIDEDPTHEKLTRSSTDSSWQLSSRNGDIETYDGYGKLKSIAKPDGATQTFSYDGANQLKRVNSSNGHQLDFGYSGDKIASITVDQQQTARLNYNAAGLINQIIRPDNSSRQYHYENTAFPKNLTGITDEKGVRFATWKYDAQGRAYSSEHADGSEKTTLAFNADGSTTVTNTLGKKTKYNFTNISGVKRITSVSGEPTANCIAAHQSYTYNSDGSIERQTDWNGNITAFSYDNLGREVYRTTASSSVNAKPVKTCWHNTLNQPSRIIEDIQTTVFDYWPNGQLKSKVIKPRGGWNTTCETAL